MRPLFRMRSIRRQRAAALEREQRPEVAADVLHDLGQAVGLRIEFAKQIFRADLRDGAVSPLLHYLELQDTAPEYFFGYHRVASGSLAGASRR